MADRMHSDRQTPLAEAIHANRPNLRHQEYTKAIGLLHEMGGMFRTKPTRQLVIGPYQIAVLRQAGCLPRHRDREAGTRNLAVLTTAADDTMASSPRTQPRLFGDQRMATVQFSNDKKYIQAITLLHEIGGGMFWIKPTRRLVISPFQIQALQNAGVLPKTNGAKKRGKKRS